MYLLFWLSIWPVIYVTNSIKGISDKINSNYISCFHSVTGTVLSYNYLYSEMTDDYLRSLLYYFSTSYFLYDSSKILIQQRWKDWAYIYHHLVCSYMLYHFSYGNDVELITKLFYLGEFSNFFNYVVYHIIKKKYNQNFIQCMKIIQLLWFAYFRVYRFTMLSQEWYNGFSNNIPFKYILISIYFMGLIWGWGQFKSTLKEFKLMIKDKKKD